MIYGPTGADQQKLYMEVFQQNFPKIKVNYTPGRISEIISRIMAEQRAGMRQADLVLGGTDILLGTLKDKGFLQPIRPALVLPEVLDSGARLAFGSDWSVAPISALQGIDAAVNRRTLDGKHPQGWFPEQRISVAEAIEAYTLTSAYVAQEERDRGSLVRGKLADFVVLSRDILDEKERDHIVETEVLSTVLGGKVVYERR